MELTETIQQPNVQRVAIQRTERKIIYLVNPVSGTAKKETLVSLIEKISNEKGLHCEIMPTNKRGNYDFLIDKIQKEEITDIVIIGGDGTVNHVVGALYNEPVNFGIIPYGSGNGLARAAGIPSKPKLAFELILNGGAKYVDAFSVNGHFACMLSGVGFDAKVAHDFAAKTTRGLLTYTQQSIINYFKAQPYQFEIEVDNFSFFSDAFFISVANANQFGNNVTIAPEAKLNDGLLDIVVVQKMNKAKLPFAVLQQIRGNNKLQHLVEEVTNKNILYFQTPEIKIKNLLNAPMHIDGEPIDFAPQINVEIIKNAYRLIRP
ncbi:diacylglycerol kinase family lipid kinase [Arachidicoccus ginsenosidivorans]|jgi:YegS/Rv2252/BmrU family lipid kinase|uniref:YegS/Rv2252/BmrU family lipid kinase n=1 Tax=Arachidicoccus ginsenosidivorans TaxID=496057 RepID=A0A5B8VND3_9BACT|nr:YegS/Rv2252/BmrU family lipid kinase [Arachidicoccus ginsenosidivorans]QEC71758.1 YegS/Rv2252/BmrU family lipid kinase [Arachidicoccus ginsenosidivorans]